MTAEAEARGWARAAPDDLVAFCRLEHPRLVGALSLYCGDAALAEELAQEALLRACRAWPRISSMAAPGAWVHRVALNLAGSHFRRRAAEKRARERYARRPQTPASIVDPADERLKQALAALPPRQRSAVVLRYFLDLSIGQTAQTLGVSEGAVKQLTHRALTTLRAGLPQFAVTEEARHEH